MAAKSGISVDLLRKGAQVRYGMSRSGSVLQYADADNCFVRLQGDW